MARARECRVVLLVGCLAFLACACREVTAREGRSRPVSTADGSPSVREIHTGQTSTIPPPPPTPALPDAPSPPVGPAPLRVPGFADASHVGPEGAMPWPAPVVVVLHGNFDRPEWECETWSRAAGFYGWILCPRGKRTPWATLAEDRWTFDGPGRVRREIEAGLVALEMRYPGRVTRERMVLAGFSLGAMLAPGLAEADPGRYEVLFLVEGGIEKLDSRRAASLAASGVRALGMAMSAPGRIRRARAAESVLLRAGMRVALVEMRGAGHNYSADFGERGRAAMEALIGGGGCRRKDGGPCS